MFARQDCGESKWRKTESNVWDYGSEDVNPFGEKPGFQEEPIVLVEEESCPVYDTDNEEKNRCRFMILILKMSLRRKSFIEEVEVEVDVDEEVEDENQRIR
ncbi:hypothetical protein Tco_1101849 [Tanacetum coccineum]